MKIKFTQDYRGPRADGKEAPFRKNQILTCDAKWGEEQVKKKRAVNVTGVATAYPKEEPKDN